MAKKKRETYDMYSTVLLSFGRLNECLVLRFS